MAKIGLDEVIKKTTPKYSLNELLKQYKSQKETLSPYQQTQLYNELSHLISKPASKMLNGGWKSPHGMVLYAEKRFEFEDLVQEGITQVLEKIDQYNTDFSASTFVYLKLEERYRFMLSKQSTPFSMSRQQYEELNLGERNKLIDSLSIEELLTDQYTESGQNKGNLEQLCTNPTNKILVERLLKNIQSSNYLSPLEKQVFHLSSGIYCDEVKNSEIEEYTNGEISLSVYRNTKNQIKKKLQDLVSGTVREKKKRGPKPKTKSSTQIKEKAKQTANIIEQLEQTQYQSNINNQRTDISRLDPPFIFRVPKLEEILEISVQIQREELSKAKQFESMYQIQGEFGGKSNFYLGLYNPHDEKSAVTKRLTQDISQLIKEPLYQLIENESENSNQEFNDYRKNKLLELVSNQILQKLDKENEYLSITKQIQKQFVNIGSTQKIQELFEETKPQLAPKDPNYKPVPVSQKTMSVKRKKKNNKSKRKGKKR